MRDGAAGGVMAIAGFSSGGVITMTGVFSGGVTAEVDISSTGGLSYVECIFEKERLCWAAIVLIYAATTTKKSTNKIND